MDRAFASGASATPPSAPASPSIGYATAGNPSGGTSPTKPGPWWFHMVTEEIRKVITDAGMTPSQTDLTQLSAAIAARAVSYATGSEAQALSLTAKAISPATLAAAFQGGNQSLGNSGYQRLPGGFIIQWVQGSASTAGEVSEIVTLPIAFPNSCLFASASTLNSAASASADTNYQIVSKTTTQVTVLRQQNPSNAVSVTPLVFAIGN